MIGDVLWVVRVLCCWELLWMVMGVVLDVFMIEEVVIVFMEIMEVII